MNRRLALLLVFIVTVALAAPAAIRAQDAATDGASATLGGLSDRLQKGEIDDQAEASTTPAKSEGFGGIAPTQGTVRSNYMQKRTKHLHTGIDIFAKKGTPVVALGDGVVVSAGWDDSYGKTVVLKHVLPSGQTLYTRYAHLLTCDVKPGTKVARGEKIPGSAVDNSGRSYGDHLHFEVRTSDGYGTSGTKNPIDYLKKLFR